MDWSLRKRLLVAFVGVVLVSGFLTVPTGSILINRLVIHGEAQRRVDLALKTADDMLQWRLAEAKQDAAELAEAIDERLALGGLPNRDVLAAWRKRYGYDLLQLRDAEGAARSNWTSPVIKAALAAREPTAGVSLMPLTELRMEDAALARQADIPVLPTPRAKPGGPERLTEAMVLEAAAPIIDATGVVRYILRLSTVINGNFEFVDSVRESVFTVSTYRGKNLGTVTIFQHDVRVATNVIGPDGKRAVGTRVSAEVYDCVLREGQVWTGPAFVVDSWYVSAYKPLRDLAGRIIGMLYVGVLKDRYDDMRAEAMRVFVGIAGLALVVGVFVSVWLADRLAHPLVELTTGATEVAKGNLDYQLTLPTRSKRDEIARLRLAFGEMVETLRERDRQLRARNEELQQWIQNYLDILEFITHELKNQIAAMQINLLAVRDGYVGQITADQYAALDDVAVTIDRSEEMILNYLNLSRIEKGELQVHAQPLHIKNDILQPVLRDVRGRLEARQMQVEIDLPPDLIVNADASLLKIVFTNLLTNAAKYGRQEGTVRVFGRRHGEYVELHVWNDGPGAPPNKVGELFRKFARLNAPGDEQPGTGLGLFITREIIRQHGGTIRADNRPGEWIDFVFSLPLPDSQRSQIPPANGASKN
ncbi:MAG: cache domain-containing protein [Candidatus Zipacnadales bacterium]